MKALPLLFLLAGCASHLTSEGRAVSIVDAAPAGAREIGTFVASATYQHDGDERDCRDDLINKAGRFGANILVITHFDRHPCVIGQQQSCAEITGRAWVTGMGQYLLDPQDPFPAGFAL